VVHSPDSRESSIVSYEPYIVEYTVFAYTGFIFTKSEVVVLTMTYAVYILLILSITN